MQKYENLRNKLSLKVSELNFMRMFEIIGFVCKAYMRPVFYEEQIKSGKRIIMIKQEIISKFPA